MHEQWFRRKILNQKGIAVELKTYKDFELHIIWTHLLEVKLTPAITFCVQRTCMVAIQRIDSKPRIFLHQHSAAGLLLYMHFKWILYIYSHEFCPDASKEMWIYRLKFFWKKFELLKACMNLKNSSPITEVINWKTILKIFTFTVNGTMLVVQP